MCAITLNVPTMFTDLMADSGTLLHEMVHQYLNERGGPAGHDSEGWRREILRLHELMIGKKIWAGASITKRQDGRVVRINAPSPTGKASLAQRQIARCRTRCAVCIGGRCMCHVRQCSAIFTDVVIELRRIEKLFLRRADGAVDVTITDRAATVGERVCDLTQEIITIMRAERLGTV